MIKNFEIIEIGQEIVKWQHQTCSRVSLHQHNLLTYSNECEIEVGQTNIIAGSESLKKNENALFFFLD